MGRLPKVGGTAVEAQPLFPGRHGQRGKLCAGAVWGGRAAVGCPFVLLDYLPHDFRGKEQRRAATPSMGTRRSMVEPRNHRGNEDNQKQEEKE